MDQSVPADAQDLREPLGIVLVVLVHPRREGRVDGTRVQADNGMARLAQAVHRPVRAGRFPAQSHRTVGHFLLERGGDHGRIGQALAAPEPLSLLVQHADADLPLRNVDPDKVRHAGCSWFQPAFTGAKRLPPVTGPGPRSADVHTCRPNPVARRRRRRVTAGAAAETRGLPRTPPVQPQPGGPCQRPDRTIRGLVRVDDHARRHPFSAVRAERLAQLARGGGRAGGTRTRPHDLGRSVAALPHCPRPAAPARRRPGLPARSGRGRRRARPGRSCPWRARGRCPRPPPAPPAPRWPAAARDPG